MLKHRLAYGAMMFAALAGLVVVDHRLEGMAAADTWLEGLLPPDAKFPPGVLILPVMLGLIGWAAGELHAMLVAAGLGCSRFGVTIAALGGCLATTIVPSMTGPANGMAAALATIAIITALGMMAPAIRHRRVDGAIRTGGATLLAAVYLGILPGFLFLIRRDEGAVAMVAVIAATKIGDSGAYFLGRLIGRHKLIPWLSPGKTWEGLGGAVLAATLALWVIDAAAEGIIAAPASADAATGPTPLPLVLGLGILIGLVGHAGDLLASLMKRDVGIKDTGTAVPGFGGLIDIFDSLLLVSPVVYLLLARA